MAKKPSLAEALGNSYGGSHEEGPGDDAADAAMYVKDLEDIVGAKKAQALYDVICAIVKAHSAGGAVTISLG